MKRNSTSLLIFNFLPAVISDCRHAAVIKWVAIRDPACYKTHVIDQTFVSRHLQESFFATRLLLPSKHRKIATDDLCDQA